MYAVRSLYTSLLILLTQATDRELARIVRYLVEENRISAPGCPSESTLHGHALGRCTADIAWWRLP